jgi:hypothetical protein
MSQSSFGSIDMLTLNSVSLEVCTRTGLNVEIDGVLFGACLRRDDPDAALTGDRLATGYF